MTGDEFRALLTDVDTVSKQLDQGPDERPWYFATIYALFDRCRSGFVAVWRLAGAGLTHEAVLLTRHLFTESLMLAELASANEQECARLVIGWSLDGLASLEGMALEAQSDGDDVTDELAWIERQRAMLRERAEEAGVPAARIRQINEKQYAARHGREGEYMDFRMTHQFVHGSTLALAQRYSKVGNTVTVGGPGAQVRQWARPAALFASRSLLEATRSLARVLDVSEPDGLDDVMRRVNNAAEQAQQHGN